MSDRFDVGQTPLPGVFLLVRKPHVDERGWIERMYDGTELGELIGSKPIIQVNRSFTGSQGTVRGLHYQVPPSAEAKIVSCLSGSIFDVAVDVRRNSPTFLAWHGAVLSADNRSSLVIPEGFAHGYQTLVDGCELLYVHTAAYEPAAERGIHPLDPRVAVAWPLTVANLSARDGAHPALNPGFAGIEV